MSCRNKVKWGVQVPGRAKQLFTPRIALILEKVGYTLTKHKFTTSNEQNSILLYGKAGTGKTILAAQILLSLCEQAYLEGSEHRNFACFVSLSDLYMELKASFGNNEEHEQEIIERYKDYYALCIDDIGLPVSSEWAYGVLYNIINHRYEQMLPTIFTSNLDLVGLQKVYKDDRFVSRLRRMCKIIKVTGY